MDTSLTLPPFGALAGSFPAGGGSAPAGSSGTSPADPDLTAELLAETGSNQSGVNALAGAAGGVSSVTLPAYQPLPKIDPHDVHDLAPTGDDDPSRPPAAA